MNADKIARALQSSRDSAAIGKLRTEVTDRQAEIKARVGAISQPNSTLVPVPDERRKALLKGPEAIARLDEEIETLNAELDYLARLEPEIYGEFAAAEKREIAAAIPGALSRVPGAKRRVREALRKLDDELEALAAAMRPLSSYDELGLPFPLTDSESADLHQLQREVWTPRKVLAIIPPGGLEMKVAFPLTFDQVFRQIDWQTFQNRSRPQFVHPKAGGYEFFNEP